MWASVQKVAQAEEGACMVRVRAAETVYEWVGLEHWRTWGLTDEGWHGLPWHG